MKVLGVWPQTDRLGLAKRLVFSRAHDGHDLLPFQSGVQIDLMAHELGMGEPRLKPVSGDGQMLGANPENGIDTHGMVASMLSVGKLDYNDALDGISLTNTITPQGLGRSKEEQIQNLVGILDAGFVPDDSCAYDGTKGY